MNTRTRRFGVAAVALAIVGMTAPLASAKEGAMTYTDGALRKLGRGLANVVTCPAELIRTPELTGRKDGYVAALSVGILKGAFRTLLRGVTGVFEVVTFPVEIPKDFAPIVQPEFVYAHGDWVE